MSDQLTQLCQQVIKILIEKERPMPIGGGGGYHRDEARHPLFKYSIFDDVPKDLKAQLLAAAKKDPSCDRAMGTMCGMALGDAYGHMFEFQPAVDEPQNKGTRHRDSGWFDVETDMFHGATNTFGLKLGQWTDDCSMGLCIADSVLVKQQWDCSDQRLRFWNWWNVGYNNAFRLDPSRSSSVGLGGNISKSLAACRPGEMPPPAYEAKTEDAGNGSLMRFGPVALYAFGTRPEEQMEIARQSSYTTHPGIIAAEACAFLSQVLIKALEKPPGEKIDPRKFIDDVCDDYMKRVLAGKPTGWGYDQMREVVSGKPKDSKEACWAWREKPLRIQESLRARGRSYNGYPVSAGYFGSYSLDGIAMALHAVYHNDTFETTVAHAINLLGDADSTGSIAGQMAGAIYGYSKIAEKKQKWLDCLNEWDQGEIALRGVLIWHMARTRGT